MGSGLQCVAFICICCLIRSVVTHPNQDEDKRLKNKRINPNSPGEGDFYFVEEKTNDDNLKTGRAIPQSAWSKEDKEPTLPIENKTDTQSSDEFSIKKILSYLLNIVHELKEEIFGIKEIAAHKKTEELPKSQDDNFENRGKQNEMGGKYDTPKPADLTENIEVRKANQPPTSNYITDYYQKNSITFTDDEERDDDLENSSDMSDDSSHKPNEGDNMNKVGKNNENTHNFRCIKIKRKPEKNYFEAEKTTTIPTSQTKINDEGIEEFDGSKEKGKYDGFKESTIKPAKTKQNPSKGSSEKTETTSPPSSKKGKCMKKTNKNSAYYLNEKNEPTEKPLKSDEYVTTVNPQNENFDQEESKISNQDKSVDNGSPGKNSENKDGSGFENKPDVVVQSTTLPSQSSKNVTFPEDENEPYASGTSSENSTFRKEQEQITAPKPEDQKRTQNNAKSLKDTNGINEHTTVSFQSPKPVGENPQHKMSTEAFTFDTEIKDSPKESKDKESAQTTVTYNENEPNSKIVEQQTSNSFDIGNTIAPTTSGNTMNTDKLNKDTSNNLSDKKGTNENDESEKSSTIKPDKNYSESLGDSEPEQIKVPEVNDDSGPGKPLKNKKLIDSNPGNNNKENDDNLTSATTNGNITNTDKLNKDPSDNLSDKKEANDNDESEKSSAVNQDKNDSETQGVSKSEQTKVEKVKNGFDQEKSLKNKKLNDSNAGNNNKEEDDNLTSATTNGNIVNTDKLNKDPSDNLSDKKGTNENDESEKSSAVKQDKNDSETQGDSESEQTKVEKVTNDSDQEKSLKNKKSNDSNAGNNNKEEVDNLTPGTTNGLPSQDSNREIQNHGIKGSDKPQEVQENNENLNKRAGMQEISPDQEYEYEEDSEDFDISDELNEAQDFNQNQEGELNTNNGDQEDDDDINPENTGTILTNESQISQHTGYVMEEKSQEQYDTFLEYFYKHSYNPYFQFLKNQSNNFSDGIEL